MYNSRTVSAATKDVLEAALRLGPEARAEVAQELLESLEDSSYGKLSPAWEAEIERRIREIETGAVELIPAEEVFAEVDDWLRSRHPAR